MRSNFKGMILIVQEQLTMLALPSVNDLHLEELITINALHEAVKSADFNVIIEKLETLLEHTEKHFVEEEKLMQEAGFEGYYPHKGEHDRHLSELKHIINYFKERQDPQAIAAYIEGNLERWTIHHINTMDVEMADFIAGQKA